MSAVLKSCPFCGSSEDVMTNREYWSPVLIAEAVVANQVGCTSCNIWTPPYETEEEAIEAWNRRATERTCRFNVVFYKDFATPRQPGNICKCDACGYQHSYGLIVDARFRYCPNCGARIEVVE